MKLILATDVRGGIAYEGSLPFNCKEDMRFFKNNTSNNIVIMGRKTWETLPSKFGLMNRINIVLTGNSYECVKSLDSSCPIDREIHFVNPDDLYHLRNILYSDPSYIYKDVYVIGGLETVKTLSPFILSAYISRVGITCNKTDKSFDINDNFAIDDVDVIYERKTGIDIEDLTKESSNKFISWYLIRKYENLTCDNSYHQYKDLYINATNKMKSDYSYIINRTHITSPMSTIIGLMVKLDILLRSSINDSILNIRGIKYLVPDKDSIIKIEYLKKVNKFANKLINDFILGITTDLPEQKSNYDKFLFYRLQEQSFFMEQERKKIITNIIPSI